MHITKSTFIPADVMYDLNKYWLIEAVVYVVPLVLAIDMLINRKRNLLWLIVLCIVLIELGEIILLQNDRLYR